MCASRPRPPRRTDAAGVAARPSGDGRDGRGRADRKRGEEARHVTHAAVDARPAGHDGGGRRRRARARGFHTGDGTAGSLLLGLGAPALGFGFWGAVDFHRAGRWAEPLRLVQEVVVSGLAALALYVAGQHVLGGALAALLGRVPRARLRGRGPGSSSPGSERAAGSAPATRGVADGLDVVAVGVAHEGAVVAGVVDRATPWARGAPRPRRRRRRRRRLAPPPGRRRRRRCGPPASRWRPR